MIILALILNTKGPGFQRDKHACIFLLGGCSIRWKLRQSAAVTDDGQFLNLGLVYNGLSIIN